MINNSNLREINISTDDRNNIRRINNDQIKEKNKSCQRIDICLLLILFCIFFNNYLSSGIYNGDKYFEKDYFQNYLKLNYEKLLNNNDYISNINLTENFIDNINNINKEYINNTFHNYYSNIIDKLGSQLKNYKRINTAIFFFCTFITAMGFGYLIFLLRTTIEIFFKLTIIFCFIFIFLILINIILSIIIYSKIKKIEKELYKSGFTNELSKYSKDILINFSITVVLYISIISFCITFKDDIEKNINQQMGKYNSYIIELKNNLDKIKKDKENLIQQIRENEDNYSEIINKRNEEINQLKNIDKQRIQNIEELKNKIKTNNQEISKNFQNEEYIKAKEKLNALILSKDQEINKLNEKKNELILELQNLKRSDLKKNEQKLAIIFQSIDQKLHYAMICKNTDIFGIIEQDLYQLFPEYKESDHYFLLCGRTINRNKTVEENNIRHSDIIIINNYDNNYDI